MAQTLGHPRTRYRAAPPGVGGSVSGRLDGHAVGQQAAALLL